MAGLSAGFFRTRKGPWVKKSVQRGANEAIIVRHSPQSSLHHPPLPPPLAGHVRLEIPGSDDHSSVPLLVHKVNLDLIITQPENGLTASLSFCLVGLDFSLISSSFWMWANILFFPLLSLISSPALFFLFLSGGNIKKKINHEILI